MSKNQCSAPPYTWLMATPDFILDLRTQVGNAPLWLSGVTAVVQKGSQILLVQRADNHKWTPVTGIIDPGEQPADAAAREVLEEAGVVAVPTRFGGISVTAPVTYENGDVSQYIDLAFAFEWVSGDPYPADGENLEAKWFELDALPEMSQSMHTRIGSALSDEPRASFMFNGLLHPQPELV